MKTKHDAEYDDAVLEDIKASAVTEDKHDNLAEDDADDENLIKKIDKIIETMINF